MIRLENPQFLYLWILIPLFYLLHYFYIRAKRKKLKQFAEVKTQQIIIPDLSIGKQYFKFTLWNLALFFLILALANPQKGTSIEKKERTGTDLMVCLDVSNSMLAEDLKPNRISRAKQSLTQLVNQLEGDRIGIVLYNTAPVVYCPLTEDYDYVNECLDTIQTQIEKVIKNNGTIPYSYDEEGNPVTSENLRDYIASLMHEEIVSTIGDIEITRRELCESVIVLPPCNHLKALGTVIETLLAEHYIKMVQMIHIEPYNSFGESKSKSIGAEYALLLAAITAIVDILPVLGVGTVLVPWSVISYISGDISRGTAILILYVAVIILRQFIEPKIIGKSLGIHPLLSLFSMYVGLRVFGVIGIILAPALVAGLRTLKDAGLSGDDISQTP